MKNTIILTGCAGFIGSNFVRDIAAHSKNDHFVVFDALTYAGHYTSIKKEIEENSNIEFIQGDVRDKEAIGNLFRNYDPNGIMHFAAESHVDRSIEGPNIFMETNALGTLNLLNASLEQYKKTGDFRFLQVSTDEVYGTLTEEEPAFTEQTPLSPNSPYSASKASADMLVRSFHETHGLPTIITRCSNNYGPFQFPEKLIPLMIKNAKAGEKLPVYGKGLNIRDWIYVKDHNEGVWSAFQKGRPGEIYNFGGNSEKRNIEVVKEILRLLNKSEDLIEFVTDRLGHDYRYAIDATKAQNELGWTPHVTFAEGLEKTIKWYDENESWVEEVLRGSS